MVNQYSQQTLLILSGIIEQQIANADCIANIVLHLYDFHFEVA